ncbi:hypothetical protein C3E97_032740, partial [Pseudomonas sp. MWU12-2115]|uniref:hypothetical protein n=1 Tax=Pseudomonas sp. MWU12-2115 TaxID=2071713 RepID=UPI000E03802E
QGLKFFAQRAGAGNEEHQSRGAKEEGTFGRRGKGKKRRNERGEKQGRIKKRTAGRRGRERKSGGEGKRGDLGGGRIRKKKKKKKRRLPEEHINREQ